jgi:hypothetical protein
MPGTPAAAVSAIPDRDMIEHMFLAGVPVRDELVLELARLGDDPSLASKLETNCGRMTKPLALTMPERETIIRALEDPPTGLAEFVGSWFANTSGKREGLV